MFESATCRDCGEAKPLSEFYSCMRPSGPSHKSYCKPCWKVRNAKHRGPGGKQHEWTRKSALKRRARMRDMIRAAKSMPCTDCGIAYPHYVMDFDHVDPKTKRAAISRLPHASKETIDAEIAKCDLVCSNCHREREHLRRGER